MAFIDPSNRLSALRSLQSFGPLRDLRFGSRNPLCSAKKIRATLEHIFITRLFAPTDTRDAGHRGLMSLQLGSRSECYAVVLEAQPSVNSDLVFRGQDWSADGLDCNVLPSI